MNLALKIAIIASGYKQKDVARRAGIDQWRLSRIVTQDVIASPREQARIARILRQSVAALFGASQPVPSRS